MTKEDLLELGIYVPEIIDDRISTYLLLGFDILVWGSFYQSDKSPLILRRLRLSENDPIILHSNLKFKLCRPSNYAELIPFGSGILSPRIVMTILHINRNDINNIIEYIFVFY